MDMPYKTMQLLKIAAISLACLVTPASWASISSTLEAELAGDPPADLNDEDVFGDVVALDGDTAVVGAHGSRNSVGAVYVLTRNTSTNSWDLEAKLSPSDAALDARFGSSVAVQGDTLVVGSEYATVDGLTRAGAAYIFTRSEGVWTEQQKLIGERLAANQYFGSSVAIDSDTVLVGAIHGNSSYSGANTGAVFIFERDTAGLWNRSGELRAQGVSSGDLFGSSVALSGDLALAGAPGNDGNGSSAGAVLAYLRSNGIWTRKAILRGSDTGQGDYFGGAVALTGNTALIGAHNYDQVIDGSQTSSTGAVYVYEFNGTSWSQQDRLVPEGAIQSEFFGSSIDANENIALIGARGGNALKYIGSAYVYALDSGNWTEVLEIPSPASQNEDYFGYAVALSGTTGIIGARGVDIENAAGVPKNRGKAYIYSLEPPADDYGDAPATYPVLTADDGARHSLSELFLGNFIDEESDGQPSPLANADDLDAADNDEDGVSFSNLIIGSSNAQMTVTTSQAGGHLDAWLDMDGDGDWDEAHDQIISDQTLATTSETLSFAIPSGFSEVDTFARVRLSSAGGLNFNGSAGDGEVEDYAVSLTLPTLSVSSGSVTEGGDLAFEVSLSTAVNHEITFTATTSDGSATLMDNDYNAVSDSFTIIAGETATIVSVSTTADSDVEPDETLNLSLSNVSGAAVQDNTAIGTIIDDDNEQPPSLTISGEARTEGEGSLQFVISASEVLTQPVQVTLNTADRSAKLSDNDYVPIINRVITLDAGLQHFEVPVIVNDDSKAEPKEKLILTISNPQGATISTWRATGTILNDDEKAKGGGNGNGGGNGRP